MKLIINLLLVLTAFVLVYFLAISIREPINFNEQRAKREEAVKTKLINIRTAQEHYRGLTGAYAATFEDLAAKLKEGKFKIVQVFGDPDDPNNSVVRYDTMFISAMDSIPKLKIGSLDSLKYVPYAPAGTAFEIAADTVTYQSTVVNVVQVGTTRKIYMGEYGEKRFRKYDKSYDPDSKIKFGSMDSPNTSGNWESK